MRISRTVILVAVLALAVGVHWADDAPKGKADQDDRVVAYLGGTPVTLTQIDKMIAGDLMKLRQQRYDLRNEALRRHVLETLLDQEAAKRDIGLADLMRIEVEEKAADPTDEQVAQYVRKYKDRDPLLQGKEEDVARRMATIQVANQLIEQRRDEFVKQVMAKADLKILFDPPRIDIEVPSYEPSLGPADAPVTIVEFSDYECPYCKRAQPTIDKLLEEFPNEVRFVLRDFPLDIHARAESAARAARCAGDQEKYWDYHGHLLSEDGSLEDDDLMRRAAAVGLDMAAFSACYQSDRHREAVKAGLSDGAAVGVTGTPTFFVNGRMLFGALPLDEMIELVKEEVKRVQK